jgi:hypothetical protein
MRIAAALAGLALVTSACKTTTATTTTVSGSPRLEPAPAAVAAPAPAPAAYSPAGRWRVGIIAQGQSMEVTLELVKLADGTWTGSIGTEQFGTIPLSKVDITDKKMVASFPVPTGDVGSMTLNFDGDNAEGEWSMPGDGSKVAGKRI